MFRFSCSRLFTNPELNITNVTDLNANQTQSLFTKRESQLGKISQLNVVLNQTCIFGAGCAGWIQHRPT